MFYSKNGTHQIVPSELWKQLNQQQDYFYKMPNADKTKEDYFEFVAGGDARGGYYYGDKQTCPDCFEAGKDIFQYKSAYAVKSTAKEHRILYKPENN